MISSDFPYIVTLRSTSSFFGTMTLHFPTDRLEEGYGHTKARKEYGVEIVIGTRVDDYVRGGYLDGLGTAFPIIKNMDNKKERISSLF